MSTIELKERKIDVEEKNEYEFADLIFSYDHSNSQQDRSKLEKELEILNKKVARFPSNSVTLRQRAIIYYTLGLYEEALNDCNKLLVIDAKNPQCTSLRMAVLTDIGRFDEALKDANNALKLSNSIGYIASIYLGIGFCYEGKNQLDEAIKAFEYGLSLKPQNRNTISQLQSGIARIMSKQEGQELLDAWSASSFSIRPSIVK